MDDVKGVLALPCDVVLAIADCVYQPWRPGVDWSQIGLSFRVRLTETSTSSQHIFSHVEIPPHVVTQTLMQTPTFLPLPHTFSFSLSLTDSFRPNDASSIIKTYFVMSLFFLG